MAFRKYVRGVTTYRFGHISEVFLVASRFPERLMMPLGGAEWSRSNASIASNTSKTSPGIFLA